MFTGIAIGILLTLVIVMGVVIYFLVRVPSEESKIRLDDIVSEFEFINKRRNEFRREQMIEIAKEAAKRKKEQEKELPSGNSLPILSSNNRDKFPHGKVGNDLIPMNLSEQELELLRQFHEKQ